MKKAITYQAALDQRKVKKDDYFLIKYPDGREILFRLDKAYTGDYVMLGPPTKGEIYLEGKKGYDNFFTLADKQVKKEYYHERAFEEVHACGLPEEEYEVHSREELCRILNDAEKRYNHPDDVKMVYALASRCVDLISSLAWFNVFRVYRGLVYANILCCSDGTANNHTYAVRPECIPKSTILLEMEEHDGSKANPWICLTEQEESQEQGRSNDKIIGGDVENVSKSELMLLIQEGQAIVKQGCKWLEKLEKYAQNLK